MMMEAGLILEGGGLRGVYTAGVLDAFLDEDLEFSSVYGVSAGSCQACSFLSKQRGRGYHTCADYVTDPGYCGVRSFLKTGNFFNVDMCYSRIPDVLNPFDHETFADYKGKLYAVVTNVETGEAEYLRVRDLKKQIWMIRASSSLPLISKTVIAHGKPYLDGGIADSIPIRKSIEMGNHKNIVILTRPEGYRKEPNPMMKAIKLRYHAYPEFVKQAQNRHIRYNETLAFLEEEEQKGNLIVIRPRSEVTVGRLEKDVNKLKDLYEIGYEDGKAKVDSIKEYMKKETKSAE